MLKEKPEQAENRHAFGPSHFFGKSLFTTGMPVCSLGIHKGSLRNHPFWHKTAESGTIFDVGVALASGH